jgi:hypothetical protein
MSRIGFVTLVMFLLMACSPVPLPNPNSSSAANTTPNSSSTSASESVNATATTSPSSAPSAAPTNTVVLTPTALPTTLPPTPTQTATATPVLTTTLSPTITPFDATTITPTAFVTASIALSTTPTVPATLRPRPTSTPAGPKTLTPLLLGQRVTAFFVGPDGSLYYGVAPSDESLQFPARPVFQLWKKPAHGDPFALTPASMRLIGGVLVHNGMIYFNEQGALRRMPDNNQVQEGEVVIRYPMYVNNENLPYGHMNHSLAVYNLNGQEVMLMAMGSLLDSSFPCAGCPANIAPPYYEDFPTGRINYATFSWLDSAHNFDAVHGVAGQFDEFARGVRNPWSITVGTVNGQTHILAVDDDPAFTPEKSDNNPANAGDELNDIKQFGNYGHPYVYAGQEPALGAIPPVVVFPDGSVPSGVAIAAGKVFVGLHNASMVVKVDLQKRTYTPVLQGIAPFNLFAVGNSLYVSDFNGIYVIDASGL